jgi:hypothetical protein
VIALSRGGEGEVLALLLGCSLTGDGLEVGAYWLHPDAPRRLKLTLLHEETGRPVTLTNPVTGRRVRRYPISTRQLVRGRTVWLEDPTVIP